MPSIKRLIDNKDYEGLRKALSSDPALANEGIPYDMLNPAKEHPLHRLCDGVFSKKITEREALEMAKIFVECGAKIDGNEMHEKKDTPLIAASSLHADALALYYIDKGADIHHAGTHGGTALHWAAWCGRDTVLKRLVDEGAEINRRCIDFKSTPLFWTAHSLKNGDKRNHHHQVKCAQILVQAGADKTILNADGHSIFDLLGEQDVELRKILD